MSGLVVEEFTKNTDLIPKKWNMWNIGETEINGKIVKLQREKYNKLLDILPSLLGDVETFKKLCIIIDECTVKLNVLKLKEILEKFEIIEQDFSSKEKKEKV